MQSPTNRNATNCIKYPPIPRLGVGDNFNRPPRTRRLPFSWLLLIFLFALAFPTAGQQPSDEDIVKVNSDLIVLNVTVSDSAAKFVRGLEQADFRVFEDGREQKINSFSAEETPFAAAILLDTSGSMEQRLSFARAAAVQFLDRLRSDDEAAIYCFDSKVEQLQDFSSSRDLAPLAYSRRASGNTVLNDAILRSAKDLATRSEKRRAIVVLSDGGENFSRVSASKALDQALAMGATIYSVDMSGTDGEATRDRQGAAILRNFSTKSGGRYVPTPGGPGLRQAFAEISDELGTQYTITYQPSNRAHDGRWRAIELKLSRADLVARTRKGYRTQRH